MQKKTKIFLILIFVVAFALRLWKINSLPYPPDGDEVAFGYYGWSLLHYGTDEYGKVLPLSFSSIGDNKYPVLAYLNTIPAAIFGLDNLTTRIVSALAGSILVVIVFFIAKLLFANSLIPLVSAIFIAISPWGIIESRLGYECMLATTLVAAAFYYILKLLEGWKPKHPRLVWAGVSVFVFLALFTYAASRVFIPIMLVALLYIFPQKKKIAAFLAIVVAVVVISMIPSGNRGRAGEDMWKGITSSQRNRLEELYVQAGTSAVKIPARATYFFHNKYRIAVYDFLARYAFHFSPNFLFFDGEASLQRIPDMGVLLITDIFLLPIGLIYILKDKKEKAGKVIISWLVISPVASALTLGGAAINRAVLMIVPLSILSAYGVYSLVNFVRGRLGRIIMAIIILGVLVSFLYAMNQIFIQKPYDMPWYKQTVNEELTKSILELKDQYKAVVTPNDDYIFFLFYGKMSPKDFIDNADIAPPSSGNWERVNRLGNIIFKMPNKCPKGGKLDVLYVCQGGEVPQNSKIIKVIYYPDGIPAYSLIEFYPESYMPAFSQLPTLPNNVHYMVDIERKFPDGIIPADSETYW